MRGIPCTGWSAPIHDGPATTKIFPQKILQINPLTLRQKTCYYCEKKAEFAANANHFAAIFQCPRLPVVYRFWWKLAVILRSVVQRRRISAADRPKRRQSTHLPSLGRDSSSLNDAPQNDRQFPPKSVHDPEDARFTVSSETWYNECLRFWLRPDQFVTRDPGGRCPRTGFSVATRCKPKSLAHPIDRLSGTRPTPRWVLDGPARIL